MIGQGFVKTARHAPRGYLAWEAAGLAWLAAADAVPVVGVLGATEDALILERLFPVRPTAADAQAFGAGLARLHDAGAAGFGAAPDTWHGDGWLGPAAEPLPLPCFSEASWGRYYARGCLRPMADTAERRGSLSPEDRWTIEGLCGRLDAGDFDDDEPPARLHGDLWAGNVVWTAAGAVLIDPAAHGGHRETDLAMLQLFGVPHWDLIVAGYQSRHPLRSGWRGRVGLHQLHPLLLHAALFGGGYGPRAGRIAAEYL